MRIISLLPSATEIVCGLGLRNQLVGVTHECDYPADVAELPKVTQTLIPHDASSGEIDSLVRERLKTERALYSLDMAVVERLRPDLIVTQALCDVCAVAESEVQSAACSLPGTPRVINLEPTSFADVMQCIRQVGEAAGCLSRAEAFIAQLQQRVDAVAARSASIKTRPSVMLLEWIDPPFCAGHWSPELVSLAGGREAIGVAGARSVTTAWEQIVAANPEVLMIACCGFDIERTMQDVPILKSYPGWETLACVKNDRVYAVDGSAYFSRPGPRLVDSLEILANALHETVHPLPGGLPAAQKVR
ncbi:cobalamin-binding protein [Novipirellula sp.]|uniref:cobalamin-binding protein n=1 Tax=Novipirellula sp. TaxID=2795430 RepID=UPI00356B094E